MSNRFIFIKEFLKNILGSPFSEYKSYHKVDFSEEQYNFACINKIPLTYLNKVQLENNYYAYKLFIYHKNRFQRIVEVVGEVSEMLESNGIEYVTFKTLRPYPEDTADIDILILGDEKEYAKGVDTLSRKFKPIIADDKSEKGFYDYKLIEVDYKSGWWYRDNVKIDFHKEIAVANLIYLNKALLSQYIKKIRLPNGYITRVFKPEAELLSTITHSIIKERAYTLSDYLTLLHYLINMDNRAIQKFISLVNENKVTTATRWYLSLTSLLHGMAFSSIPQKLAYVLEYLGGFIHEAFGQFMERVNPPYSCNFRVLSQIIYEKIFDPIFIVSSKSFLSGIFNRTNLKRLLDELTQ